MTAGRTSTAGWRSARRWAHTVLPTAVGVTIVFLCGLAKIAAAHDDIHGKPHFKGTRASPTAVMRALQADAHSSQNLSALAGTPCVNGFADIYPCHGVDLLAFLPLAEIGGGALAKANDIWGWADPASGREFALVGRNDGTAFVEITDAANPVYLGRLPTHTSASSWRDIKVYADHAYIVSEASGHGLQVFDLRQLLGPLAPPVTFAETAQYNAFGNAHNVVVNEASGFAYAVGSGTCSGGLHMIDILVPAAPVFASCFGSDGYTHDAQCVIYDGPDSAHAGNEVCFAANEDTLTIVDVSDKNNPVELSRTGYAERGYTHQVWLSENHELLLLDDELDERNFGHGTRTRVWDVSDLDNPAMIDDFVNETQAIDHNLYVKGDAVYQANYRAGLSVLEILRDLGGGYSELEEVAYFDIYPSSDSANFNGAWSNYPYFPSGTIVVSGIEQGLFVLALNIPDQVAWTSPGAGAALSGSAVPLTIFARDGNLEAAPPTVEWKLESDLVWQPTLAAGSHLYEASLDSSGLTDGPHQLVARMTDDAGNQTEATVSLTVSNFDAPPTAAFLSPSDDDTVSGIITLTATAGDGEGVIAVTFFDNGEAIGTDSDPSGGWTVNWNTKKVSKDLHTLTVQATDTSGQLSDPASYPNATISVTVAGGKGGGPGGGGGNTGGGNGADKCFKNKEPYCG